MRKKLYILLLCGLSVPFLGKAQEHQNLQDSLVEVSGVTLTADSSLGIPNVSIFIKGTDRGTISNGEGVFSIVTLKGDQLVFRAIGFKTKIVQIPSGFKGNH
ncbi:MAG: carboxypeptidase-like regulatory domain-containing protein, partial [Chitinophagaceae bacterium]